MALVEIVQAIHKAQPLSLRLYAVDGATVYVRKPDGTEEPVYATSAGGVPVTQPLTSQNGRIEGWVEEGRHMDLVVSKPGEIVGYTQRIVSGGGPIGATGPAGPKGDKGDPGGLLDPGAYTDVTASRALGTNYQASTTRPVLVIATLYIDSPTNAEGRIQAYASATTPASMLVANTRLSNFNASNVRTEMPLTFLVATGYYYRLASVVIAGAPVFSLVRVVELTL